MPCTSSTRTAVNQPSRLAARLGIRTQLNLNFLPQSLFSQRDFLTPMLDAASESGLPIDSLVLEVTEGEVIDDVARFAGLIKRYRAQGLKLAIDDFGAGYCGLNLLAEFQPDILKLDMALLRGIEHSGPRQAIVRAILSACTDLGIDAIAEGVETVDEFSWLADEGVTLFQGYLFGRPGFETLPGRDRAAPPLTPRLTLHITSPRSSARRRLPASPTRCSASDP